MEDSAAAIDPGTRSCGFSHIADLADELFAAGAEENGHAEPVVEAHVRQHTHIVMQVLAESDSRIDDDLGPWDSRLDARIDCRDSRKSKTSSDTSEYCGLSFMVFGSPCACMSITGSPRSAATESASGSWVSAEDVIEDIGPRTRRAPHHLGLARVDRNELVGLPAKPFDDGMTRESSSSSATASEPGLVLSRDVENVGPFLRKLQGMRNRRLDPVVPPAIEKLSGVTFTIPMMRVRSMESPASRPRGWRRFSMRSDAVRV